MMALLIATSAVAGAAGAGFALLVSVSPFGTLRFKPFTCKTCLSGWGSIFASGVLLYCEDGLFTWPLSGSALVSWAVVALAGTGVAHLILRSGAPTSPTAPADLFPPDGPTGVGG